MPAWQNSIHNRNLGGAQTPWFGINRLSLRPVVRIFVCPRLTFHSVGYYLLISLRIPKKWFLPTRVESAQGRPAVQQLTDVEVRKFYAAYRALEKRVHKLGRTASDYHEAAIGVIY